MTAPRTVAPSRPARRTGTATPSRPAPPDLRLVPAPRTRTRVRMVLTLSTILVFGVMLLAAAVHTTIVSGQRELDQVDQRIAETSRQNQSLRLEVAELESPARIVEAATADGMVVPEDVTWLAPQAGAATDPDADPAATDPAGPEVDERAGDDGGRSDDPGGSDR